jgi:hypothetical protein
MKRHTRRPPPTCKSSWREGRIALTPFHPAVLTGWVSWKDLSVSPPVDVACLIDVFAQSGPTEYFGSTSLPGAVLTLSLNTNADPTLYDLVLSIKTQTYVDDDSWHDQPRPLVPCLFDTGLLSHIHTPGLDENHATLSV